jgi:hypothetical protein
MATRRLVNVSVKNVSAVDSPANRRRWLIVKAAAPKSENEKQRVAIGKTAWTTAYVNDLPDSAFAVISPGGEKDDEGKTVPRSLRHLPYRNADGEIDLPHLRNALARLNQIEASEADKARARRTLLAAARASGIEAAEKMEHPMTFDDAMLRRRINGLLAALGDHFGALTETLYSVLESTDEDKPASMRTAIQDFTAAVAASLPVMMAELLDQSVEKIGRKISATRLEKLRTLYKTLGEIIAEAEGERHMEKQTKPDAGALARMGQQIAAMFGRVLGADEAAVTALEKAAAGTPEAPIPEAVQTELAKAKADADELRKTNIDLAARLEKAEAATKAATDAAAKLAEAEALRKFADEVSGYKAIGVDPAKDAAILKAIEERVGQEAADRIRELWKAQLAQQNAATLMGEIGATGAGNAPADTAAGEVASRVDAALAKSERLTRDEAMRQVFAADPALYERYRRETLVRV